MKAQLELDATVQKIRDQREARQAKAILAVLLAALPEKNRISLRRLSDDLTKAIRYVDL